MVSVAKALAQPRLWIPGSRLVFATLLDARESLVSIALSQLSLPFERVVERFKTWCGAFYKFRHENQDTLNNIREKRAFELLEILKQYMGLGLEVKMLSSLDDTQVWDSYSSDFNAMVDKVLHLQDLDRLDPEQSQYASQPHFQLETGIIGPLYGTIIRCRDPVIRRRALTALESHDIQEGLWSSKRGSAVARRAMELEESGRQVVNCDDIPREARIMSVLSRSNIENDDDVYFQYLHGWEREPFGTKASPAPR